MNDTFNFGGKTYEIYEQDNETISFVNIETDVFVGMINWKLKMAFPADLFDFGYGKFTFHHNGKSVLPIVEFVRIARAFGYKVYSE